MSPRGPMVQKIAKFLRFVHQQNSNKKVEKRVNFYVNFTLGKLERIVFSLVSLERWSFAFLFVCWNGVSLYPESITCTSSRATKLDTTADPSTLCRRLRVRTCDWAFLAQLTTRGFISGLRVVTGNDVDPCRSGQKSGHIFCFNGS